MTVRTHIAPIIQSYYVEHERNETSSMNTQTEFLTRLHGRWLLIARPPWLFFILTCILSVLSFVFLALSWATPVPDIYGFRGEAVILALAFGSIGLLLARRQPQNPIGWLLLVAGLVSAIVELCFEYAIYALLTKSGALPHGTLAAWIASWIWFAAIAMLIYSFLLFPTGHLPSARWRPVAWFVVGAFALMTFAFMIRPGPLQFTPYLENPLAVPVAYRMLSPLQAATAGAILLIGLSVILRLRRAQGIERQQLKWFAYAAALQTIIGMTYSLAGAAGFQGLGPKFYQYLTVATWIVVSLAIAFGILRYRLWDIDIIISHTLVYGTLSAGIVVTYILLVSVLGTLLNTHVDLAAAFVTAALIIPFFQPLRLRLQRAVDRVTFGGRDAPSSQRENAELQLDSEMSFRQRWLEFVHGGWFVLALLAAIVLIGTVPVYYNHYAQSIRSDAYALGQFNVPFQVLIAVSDLVSGFVSFALAVLLFWRKPNDRMALFVSLFFLFTSVAWSHLLDYFLTAYFGAPSTDRLWSELSTPATILLFCIFPDGHFVPRWTRWIFLYSILMSFSYFAIPEGRLILGVIASPQFILVTYAQVYRYRRLSSTAERQQTKWVVFGLFVSLALWLIASFIYKKPSPPLLNVIPIFLAIAILRYRLWDIDLIINRALVYGALTAGIVALYILLVGALSLISQSTGNLLISLLATGLIAFLFQPLRERLQRGVNRLVYGERDDPYAVLSRLGQRLEAAYAPESVLPTIVETVAQTLKIPYVGIALHENGKFNIAAEFGRSKKESISLPLNYQGEVVGELILAPRAPGEQFTSAERQLLDDLARQTGVAAHAVRLTADLQHSRERLVTAREEERRRLRRDLHDGLGPQLAGLALKLETLRNRLKEDPLAESLLADLAKRTYEATADIRRLVYELRPPTLDELGLVSALREGAMQYSQQGANGVYITFDAPESLPPLPAAVEVAVYRIAQEALTNVVRHAEARTCSVHLRLDESAALLCLEVKDDGRGMPIERRAGVGLNSMRERAEELGGTLTVTSTPTGGTLLTARLPCRVTELFRLADRNKRDGSSEKV
jgi:signal transduction histidine kinase